MGLVTICRETEAANMRIKEETKMKNCILCGTPTTGSIGAAGMRWSFICQPCKDVEDEALRQKIEVQAKTLDMVVHAFGG